MFDFTAVLAPEQVSKAALDCERPIGFGLTDELEWLRGEDWGGSFRLDLWSTNHFGSRGNALLAYRLAFCPGERGEDHQANWQIIFTGADFEPGMGTLIDSDQALADILGFLALRPGDTEPDYFKQHAAWQIAWAQQYGEELSCWSAELEGELD